jgi:hypothetical protein
MFAFGSVTTGFASYYYGGTPRSPWVSAAIGIACGVALVAVGYKRIAVERGGRSPEIAIRPFSLFSAVVALAGLVICVWGLATSNWGLSASGLPLAVLGLTLVAARWRLRSRG